ncbi:MAG: hypothetical protein K2W33_02955, partial [Burkholderiales bacterium]|nr:hypothetical protein [Burkholderiales bacterium]
MQPSPPPASLDFALLQQTLPSQGLRSRRTLWLLLGMLLLVIASVVALVLYLQNFERAEENRRRVVDGQWLEQSVRFHFNRLEEDLLVLARQAVDGAAQTPFAQHQGGLLWSESGAVLWHGWLPKQVNSSAPDWSSQAPVSALSHPGNADTLASMLDIAVGLRRSA